MMRRAPRLLVLLALCSGCGWSNSLYLARQYSKEARSDERKGRPFEAQVLWGQVQAKAESAWARSGGKGNEARAYLGIAHARLGDCNAGIRDMESALFQRSTGGWQEWTHFELGRCQQQLQLPGAENNLRGLLLSHDNNLRVQAGVSLSAVYLDRHDWPAVFTLLPAVDHPALRFGRAVAEVATGKEDQGRQDVAPLLGARDTTVAWQRMIEVLSTSRSPWTDSLYEIIQTFPNVSVQRRSEWLLAGVRGAFSIGDTLVGDIRLAQLGKLGGTVALYEGRRISYDYRISRVASLDELAKVIARLPAPGPEDGGPNHRMLEILRTAGQILSERDSLTAVPQGDLRLLAQAGDAASILNAPLLARASLEMVERSWPTSPYLVKAMLERIVTEGDSADALRARLSAHPTSAYIGYVTNENDDRFVKLEDSLARFLNLRAVAVFSRSAGGANQLFQK